MGIALKKLMRRIWRLCSLSMAMLLLACGCAPAQGAEGLLEPAHPVRITLWHYHNGFTRDKFESLVGEFNQTEGARRGVIVNASSLGDIDRLSTAVFNAIKGKVGASRLPDLFFAYPDMVYQTDQMTELVNLRTCFSEAELQAYRQDFIQDGVFSGNRLLLFPVSKSSEALFLNKTNWVPFAEQTGATLESLASWEGIRETAERYYDWTLETEGTGRAFFSLNSPLTFTVLSATQMEYPLLHMQPDGTFELDERVARLLWEGYWLPVMQGYFTKVNLYSSDDARTGLCVAYVGSTAGAGYFPTNVTRGVTNVFSVEPMVLPYPVHRGGKKYAPLRGAGLCMVKSDEVHEYAAALFLKWFTSQPQNAEFAAATGYMPVQTDALDADLINTVEPQALHNANVDCVRACIETVIGMLDTYEFYSAEPFQGSYAFSQILGEELQLEMQMTLDEMDKAAQAGATPEELRAAYSSESAYRQWLAKLQEKIRSGVSAEG